MQAAREGDASAPAEILKATTLARSVRSLERHEVALRLPDGAVHKFDRDVLRSGPVAGVLPIDIARGQVVLLRQFRLAAHLLGHGDMVEIVAGRADKGEAAEDTARRECREDIGVAPDALFRICEFIPAPALTVESMTLFAASVDSVAVPAAAGVAADHEFIRTLTLTIEDALEGLHAGRYRHAPLIIALQWLALNRGRLNDLFGAR